MTLFEAIDIAEKFNDKIFTPEMEEAINLLVWFANKWSFLTVKDDGEIINFWGTHE